MVNESSVEVAETEEKQTTELSEKDAKIIAQVEYYFGDINLPRDKFLSEQIKADDGWVPLETMVKFKRLAVLSTDFVEIATALKQSDTGLIEVNPENDKIRRSPHLPLPEMNEERRKALMARSAYVRRFPLDHTIEDILKFCAANCTNYESVIMRHYRVKADNAWKFKGSIFVIFKTMDACKQFVESEELEYNGEKLVKMWQKDHHEEKRRERLEDKKNHKSKGQAAKNSAVTKDEDKKATEVEEAPLPLGAVINLTGFTSNSQTKRESIKAKIEGYGIGVVFIDFNIGDQAAWVRLDQKDAAKELAKKVAEDGEKMKVDEDELSLRVLDGEEEQTYLVKAKEQMLKWKNNSKNKYKKGGNRRGRGGGRMGRGGRKRTGSPMNRNAEKKQKAE